jgi:EcsC family protein
MTNPANPDGQRAEEEDAYLDPAGGVVGRAFGAAPSVVPPEIQQILNVKPGKTHARIQQVIAWAAAPDAEVLREHRRHNKSIHTTADIRAASMREKDHVANHFARQYRHRAALTGAVTALPGGLWALVGMGADVQLTAIYAVRMAAKIAQSYGYDTSVVEEQANLADVLALAAGVDSLRGVGNWLAREGMVQFLPEVLPRVLARLSVELTAEQAAKWIGRIVPGVSAAIGASVDYAFLRAAGERAIAYYHNRALNEGRALPGAGAPLALPAAPDGEATAARLAAPPPASTIVEAEPAELSGASARSAAAVAATAATPAAPRVPVTAAPAAPAAAEAPMPVKRRSRHWGLYLLTFVIVITLATIIACAAFGTVIANLLQSVVH